MYSLSSSQCKDPANVIFRNVQHGHDLNLVQKFTIKFHSYVQKCCLQICHEQSVVYSGIFVIANQCTGTTVLLLFELGCWVISTDTGAPSLLLPLLQQTTAVNAPSSLNIIITMIFENCSITFCNMACICPHVDD